MRSLLPLLAVLLCACDQAPELVVKDQSMRSRRGTMTLKLRQRFGRSAPLRGVFTTERLDQRRHRDRADSAQRHCRTLPNRGVLVLEPLHQTGHRHRHQENDRSKEEFHSLIDELITEGKLMNCWDQK